MFLPVLFRGHSSLREVWINYPSSFLFFPFFFTLHPITAALVLLALSFCLFSPLLSPSSKPSKKTPKPKGEKKVSR